MQHNAAVLDYAEQLGAQLGERVWVLVVRPPEQDLPTVSDNFATRAAGRNLLVLDLRPVSQRPDAFVAMSYGEKFDPVNKLTYDCDPVFKKVYLPLLEDLDVNWTRADLQTDCGLIHVAMVKDLANSSLVIADLATSNFNVAYELGMRHVFAPHSTVLVNPILAGHDRTAPPFDVGVIRTVSFERGLNLTDQQAEVAIATLKPVLDQVLADNKLDSPVHEWFDLEQLKGPFLARTESSGAISREIEIRERVKQAIRSSSAADMLAAMSELDSPVPGMDASIKLGLRIELGSAILNEGEYTRAAEILGQLEPPTGNSLHQLWIRKMVMAFRRIGERTEDDGERDIKWSQAEGLLKRSLELGYKDSETYGIYAGLVKQRLINDAHRLQDYAIDARLTEMRRLYEKGWKADPTYYTGVNLVMTLRIIRSRKNNGDEAIDELLNETMIVTRFLVNLAMADDSLDFWAAATKAELLLHEALMTPNGITDAAASGYAKAGLLARREHRRSAVNQLEFLRRMGDPDLVIDKMIDALNSA